MQRDPTDPQSYFAVAGIHWFPEPFYCVHHEPRYNPWHRVYVDKFEAALRAVPDCEDLRLPYWDILAPMPDWFFTPPFDSYIFQAAAGADYPIGHRTERYAQDEIAKKLNFYNVPEQIREAMNSPQWERFTGFIEGAHDGGHVSCGPSMRTPDIAAFDPLFWFFHCNWERMWWSWQKREAIWLDTPPFNELMPFENTAGQTIDTNPYVYEEIGDELFDDVAKPESGSIPLDRAFRLSAAPRLSIRVKAIARLRIEGSFVVHLFADGEDVARRAFFQARAPEKCVSCATRETVNIDFILDRATIADKRLEVRIETLAPNRVHPWVPLSEVGSPTINVRELLASE
jgi:tyrosinase